MIEIKLECMEGSGVNTLTMWDIKFDETSWWVGDEGNCELRPWLNFLTE